MNKTSRLTQLRFAAVAATILFVALATMIGPLANILHSIAEASATSSVIIQFNDDPAAVWQAKQKKAGTPVTDADIANYRSTLKTKQDQFLASLQARGISYQVSGIDEPNFDGTTAGHIDFRYTLVLNGMSLKVPTAAISTIRSMTAVKKVEPNEQMHILLEKSVDYIRAPQVYGVNQEITPFQSGPTDGYEGQGMNVAVLDTGEDWTNAMYGGDPTPPRLGLLPPAAPLVANSNQKIIYYLTFTGGLPDGFGHGTHSSADIAGYLGIAPGADKLPGTADDVKLHGVAPQAKIMGYKVCADVGSCLTESTIMAIEDAVSPTSPNLQPKPIAHVINMSLGGAGGPDDATAVASDNAALLGTIVVASAGNSGPGEATVGSPASGRHVIAVGANTDPGGGSHTVDAAGKSGMIANLMDGAQEVTTDINSPFVYCGLAETPADCPSSVRGKIALIARGSTYTLPALPAVGSLGTGLFSNKAATAQADGAIAALIYNNVDGELEATTVRAATIPILGMSKANGEFLRSLCDANRVSTINATIRAAKAFSPQMADFSSRGPVQGLGQVKPDVTAPGVDIYSATVRVGAAETNTGTMYDPTGYIHASGTSFSGPHVSGAALLIKQAHMDWGPDQVRTALINTATNLRSGSGTPKPDGSGADDIISQGGGLIDVYGAIHAPALMGVTGDGIVQPAILGSYSFGEAPILNNRIVNTRSVTVTVQDLTGQGGKYNLSTANNRYFDRAGISASTNVRSVNVPAGGSTTFTANVSVDGDRVRDNSPLELQWYVIATNAVTGKSIHMPMYFKADPSLPDAANGTSQTDTFTGTVLLGDAGQQHDAGLFVGEGFTYNDVPFTVGPNTVKVDGDLSFTDAAGVDAGLSDLDLYLVDPAGNIIGSSAIAGGPEHITASVNQPGQYIWRVYGWLAADTPYTLTSTQTMGGSAPTVAPIAADYVDSSANRYDFDGAFRVNWTPVGTPDGYEVE
ncbi:MAG: S8 family serine peptidase, partial [Pyrinomonadaceae bacterium]